MFESPKMMHFMPMESQSLKILKTMVWKVHLICAWRPETKDFSFYDQIQRFLPFNYVLKTNYILICRLEDVLFQQLKKFEGLVHWNSLFKTIALRHLHVVLFKYVPRARQFPISNSWWKVWECLCRKSPRLYLVYNRSILDIR